MKYIICFSTIIFLNACTLSFQNVMTSGTASDVVDSAPQTDADVSPDISIPAAVL